MKIVVISDVHANLDALNALPEWGDELWVLGDLVDYGPEPGEVVELIQARSKVVVRGNHDHAVGFGEDPRCTPRYRKMALETQRFTIETIKPAVSAFLQQIPLQRIVERDGKRFHLCHATPSDPLYGYCLELSEMWTEEVAGNPCRFPAGGPHACSVHPQGRTDDRGQSGQSRPAQDRKAGRLLCRLARRPFRTETISLIRLTRP